MGAEMSYEPVHPSTTPDKLRRRDLKSVAEYILSGECKKIVMIVGAGISTSAGIPDFRSPDTGLYANLARLNLPHPEAVFELSYFRENPVPFYTLAHDLYPGRFRPTITHSFIRLLYEKRLLHRCFTQNIDALEHLAGIPADLIVEAHGSFKGQHCIDCNTYYEDELMKKDLKERVIPHCAEEGCGGLVKPDIVFFGEALPQRFHLRAVIDTEEGDLAIVMGTSLSVMPFASLPQRMKYGEPRLLMNKDRVGDLGARGDDVIVLGDCDSGVRKLCSELGWLEELEALWAETEMEKSPEEVAREEREKNVPLELRLEEEVEKITRDIEQSLNLAQNHKSWVEQQLAKEKVTQQSAREKMTQYLSKEKVTEATSAPVATSTPPADNKSVVNEKAVEKDDTVSGLSNGEPASNL